MARDPFSDGLAILVAEDDPVLRETVRECMLMDGYVVDAVATVADAISSLDGRAPAVMVLDLNLADSRAEPVLERIASLGQNAPPTVLVSASPDGAAIARRFGVLFLRKPFDLEELSELVAKEVARRTAA